MAIYRLYCKSCKETYETICSYSKLQDRLKGPCKICEEINLILKPSSGSFTFAESTNSNTEVTSYDGRPTGYNDW